MRASDRGTLRAGAPGQWPPGRQVRLGRGAGEALHPDFQQAARSGDRRLAYAALMIGNKESIAFNDRTGTAGGFLEKLLDFYFKLHAREWKKSKRGKQRAAPAGAEQETLELTELRPDNTLRP